LRKAFVILCVLVSLWQLPGSTRHLECKAFCL
jgi:hypothetical protein